MSREGGGHSHTPSTKRPDEASLAFTCAAVPSGNPISHELIGSLPILRDSLQTLPALQTRMLPAPPNLTTLFSLGVGSTSPGGSKLLGDTVRDILDPH